MDFIDGLEIEISKNHYYPGEIIEGNVLLCCSSHVKIRGLTINFHGKSQVSWKVVKNGAVYTVKNVHTLYDEKSIICGADSDDFDGHMTVLNKGPHKIPFQFKVPDTELPSSFESRLGVIRYFLHVIIDIPYASAPQTMKYFTIIGSRQGTPPPEWLVPLTLERKDKPLCSMCSSGDLSFEFWMARTAFCCGENIPVQMEVCNSKTMKAWPIIQLIQKVEYYIDKHKYGMRKDVEHTVWEYKGPAVPRQSTVKLDDLSQVLQIPAVPPSNYGSTMCDSICISYVLKLAIRSQGRPFQFRIRPEARLGCIRSRKFMNLSSISFQIWMATSKWGEVLTTVLPINITPYYPSEPDRKTFLQPAIQTVEGGNYLSPEVQSGQVYDGTTEEDSNASVYKPAYICIDPKKTTNQNHPSLDAHSSTITKNKKNTQPKSQTKCSSNSTAMKYRTCEDSSESSSRVTCL